MTAYGEARAEMMKRVGDILPSGVAWKAVQSRDKSSDGRFVFAVRTTGVFCRPSCPARRPNRGNVEFFLSAEEAIAAGYRGCKRCNPEAAIRTLGEKRVRDAAKHIEQHPGESLSLDALASRVKLSPFHLQREFKRLFGLSPRAYQAAIKVGRLKSRLGAGETVSRASYESGFGSSRAVYEAASKTMGMTPGEYRRGGKGKSIRYGVTTSVLGKVLVAATAKGICAVSLGDNLESLEQDLAQRFPEAVLIPAGRRDPTMRAWLDGIQALAAGKSASKLPLDLQGTAFQLRVWKALQEIPSGSTRTYSEVASELGASGASRAVGSACARNPVALLVPCHRVLRSDGDTGGYRWGPERKRKLLSAEKRGGSFSSRIASGTK